MYAVMDACVCVEDTRSLKCSHAKVAARKVTAGYIVVASRGVSVLECNSTRA